MKRLFLLFLLLPAMTAAQTQKTRADLYSEIDTNLASGQSIRISVLRDTLKNVVASAENTQNGPVDVDLAALGALSTTGFVDRVGSGNFATRSWAQIWTGLMADPQGGTYSYATGLPFTIANDKRLLGRDTAVPPFTAQEISIGAGLTLSMGALSLTSNVITIAGTGTSLGGSISRDTITGVASNGLLARTAANTLTNRTIAGTANEIAVNNGDGVAGNPTISLPNTITLTGKAITGGTFSGGAFNGSVGATTPSTGAFTTLSASGTVSGNSGHFGSTTGADLGVYAYRNNAVTALRARQDGAGSIAEFLTVGGASVGIFTSTGLNSTAIGATTPSTGVFSLLGSTGNVYSGNNGFSVDSGSTDGGYFNPSGLFYLSGNNTDIMNLRRRSSDGMLIRFNRDTSNVGSISVTTTATAFNTSSDSRLKANVRDFAGSAAVIDGIKPRVFDWKTGERDAVGFIAQELNQVFPAAVTAGDEGETIERQWQVDNSKLVPVLVAEVQALRARVAALEVSDRRQNRTLGCTLMIASGLLIGVSIVTIKRRR